jgi:hypothetical protein
VRACVIWLVIGCGGGSDSPPDAARPDARVISTACQLVVGRVECKAGIAHASFVFLASADVQCERPGIRVEHTCSAGCNPGLQRVAGGYTTVPFQFYADNLALLCTDAPEAQSGQACAIETAELPTCIPTRARLAGDGTVESQPFLRCDNGTCVARQPAPDLLVPCDAALVATYAAPNVVGVINVYQANEVENTTCVLAWDSGTQQPRHRKARACIGDWNCPAGMLCDAELTMLEAQGEHLAVCKFGPRGVLTPAMLTP